MQHESHYDLVAASVKSSFDGVDNAIRHAAVNMLTLDRALARYGPEATGIRGNLKLAVASAVFLVLEMDGPFQGLITVSPEPLAFAQVHMNR